jgi:hypothetical protein
VIPAAQTLFRQALLPALARKQLAQTLVLLDARWAAAEVRPHAGHHRIRVGARKLELDVPVQLVEALLATELVPLRSEETN